MSPALEKYIPKNRDWFKAELLVEGPAVATFSLPEGTIRGTAKIAAPVTSITIDLRVEELDSQIKYGFEDVFLFLQSQIPVSEGNVITYRAQAESNPCTSLTVSVDDGVFESQGVLGYGFFTDADGFVLRIYPKDFKFKKAGAIGTPKYWVAPLVNMVTEYPIAPSELNNHPLRLKTIFPIPQEGLEQKEFLWASLAAHQGNRLFVTGDTNDLMFMEPLPGCERLKTDEFLRLRDKVTAILVGELKGRNADTFEDLRTWFPVQLLSALSFSTGFEVSIPWIEIRTADGQLLTRLHVGLGHSTDTIGDSVFSGIHVGPSSGLGDFVSKYLALPEDQRRSVGIAMDLHLAGTPGSGNVENNLTSVFRAFDNLAEFHGFSRLNLTENLDAANTLATKDILDAARKALSELRKENRKNALFAQSGVAQDRILEKIQSRLANVATSETDFGLSVVKLADHHRFPDADILDSSYIPNKYGGKTWGAVLSELRGATMHLGYIEFENVYNIKATFEILRHLHDLLTRIILRECGYLGRYRTHLTAWNNDYSVDWVKPDFDASKLRFTI
jgi:hypothetical protein